jgi:streptomycin 6-kinase
VIVVPEGFARAIEARHGEEGRAWIDALPGMVAGYAERWSLSVGEPYPSAYVGFVVRVDRADGTPAVLKISPLDRETRHEAAALEAYGGRGAVRLLADDRTRCVLLMERCEPGVSLETFPDVQEATRLAAGVLGDLWRADLSNPPFERAGDRAAEWAATVPRDWETAGRPFPRRLADQASRLFDDLSRPHGQAHVLLHQDFHYGNVLAATRQPWLAIDPKPLIGDPASDTGSMLRNRTEEYAAAADPTAAMARRVDLLVDRLELDRERVVGWALAQAVELGLYSYSVGERAGGDGLIAVAALLAGLLS